MKKKLTSLGILAAIGIASADSAHPIMQSILDTIMLILTPVVKASFDVIVWMISRNPTVYCMPSEAAAGCTVSFGFDRFFPYFFDLLIPLYIVAFMFTAIYFIVKTTNARSRARAKAMLAKLILGTIVIGMSPLIYQVMLDISGGLVNFIYEGSGIVNFEDLKTNVTAGGAVAAIVVIILTYLLIIPTIAIVACIRYFMVVTFALIFPLLLFLYFFDLTRGFGRKWLRQAVGWIMVPPLQALFLVLTVESIDSIGPTLDGSAGFAIAGPIIGFFMTIAGLLMVGLAPLMINQLMSLVGGGVVAIGLATNSPWVAGVGGVLEGQKSKALNLTKSVLTRANPASSGLYAAIKGTSGMYGESDPGVSGFGAAKSGIGGGKRKISRDGMEETTGVDRGTIAERGVTPNRKEIEDAVSKEVTAMETGITAGSGTITTARQSEDVGSNVGKIQIGNEWVNPRIDEVVKAERRLQLASGYQTFPETIKESFKEEHEYHSKLQDALRRVKAGGVDDVTSDMANLARMQETSKIRGVRKDYDKKLRFEQDKQKVESMIEEDKDKERGGRRERKSKRHQEKEDRKKAGEERKRQYSGKIEAQKTKKEGIE